MKLVKPSYDFIPQEEMSLVKSIELAARTCYKSEDKISEDESSAIELVQKLVKRNHNAMLEFGHNIIMEMSYEAYYKLIAGIHPNNLKYLNISHDNYSSLNNIKIVSGSARAMNEVFHHTEVNKFLQDNVEGYNYIATEVLSFTDEAMIYVNRNITLLTQADLRKEHLMVHGTMTVKFVCNRGVSHELVRHRPASFAQESTRYVDYIDENGNSKVTYIIPDWSNRIEEGEYMTEGECIDCATHYRNDSNVNYVEYREAEGAKLTDKEEAWLRHMALGEFMYHEARNNLEQSPQEARDRLPIGVKTEIVVKTTYKHWNHIFRQRAVNGSHPQMIELMRPLLIECQAMDIPGTKDITF